ncbi:dihydrolipoamide acetyltransferase component of pyruvate dehydrogenase complex [Streptomyces longisporoflavus]|uniref:dihydrolipoamide acetyltransferase family protein n=1 Tax=Streptomyces longisporoflavus TaxID=28044 RepID=UPI00167CA3C4|nr:dihydrolipoamide acetyltransferase family protein [Streptomyces longisporoflavus]GGV50121.1 dihydrolipoamide acetyltransferase component of pyruvate dehydrogenase complex [Streptomyces longisporoflavus]
MAQVLEFKLPDLGEGLTEAEITRWLVQVGDVVAVDQPVVEVETAKAMVEVPCPYGGVVTARFGDEGTELPVGAPLLTVAVGAAAGDAGAAASGKPGAAPSGDPGADLSGDLGAAPEEPAERALQAAGAEESSGNVLVGYGTAAAPARRRRVRAAGSVTQFTPKPAARPVTAKQPPQTRGLAGVSAEATGSGALPHADGPIPVISPLVRKLARENGVELRELTGSGPDGLIMRADVERAIAAEPASVNGATAATLPSAPAPTHPPVHSPAPSSAPASDEQRGVSAGAEVRHSLTGIRGLVADKMSRSRREIPEATCWVDADATELLAARTAMNAAGKAGGDGRKISLLALFARISVAALARYPMLNSTVDMEAREVVQLADVHLGFAAQTDRGLVVPVVRNANTRTTDEVNAELVRLTEAARDGRLTPAQLTGGTFTLNNYGVFGVDGSTPIINHPEAAMLGVGRIVPKPWVHQGELAVRHVVQLSLTFDHRVCDGGTAGGFLRFVADCVEQPAVLLRAV